MRRLPILMLAVLLGSGACELPSGCDRGGPSDEGEGPGATAASEPGAEGIRVPVLRVVDGDTIRVRYHGESERVRYIGIDTPETHHPRIGQEPFGPEATEANRRLVEGAHVRLVFGRERRDHYGRLLAYVYLEDGTFVNAELVEQGWAEPLRVPPNDRHAARFEHLAARARAARRGMWAAERGR